MMLWKDIVLGSYKSIGGMKYAKHFQLGYVYENGREMNTMSIFFTLWVVRFVVVCYVSLGSEPRLCIATQRRVRQGDGMKDKNESYYSWFTWINKRNRRPFRKPPTMTTHKNISWMNEQRMYAAKMHFDHVSSQNKNNCIEIILFV